uniref:Fanconi anemia group C protein isoform X1 n=1 Tax=Pogona vitticeps TaxID=103695 RepID=A0ABM5FSQ4_9SAUR
MAEEARITKLSFEFWLHKTLKWGQSTTSESQQDVCLHLPELQEFLLQIYGVLKHMSCSTAIQEFPLIGQLLGRLCWNPFVVGYDECQKILMWCLCCLYSGEPQNPVELKANSWIQYLATVEPLLRNLICSRMAASSLCYLLSFFGLGYQDTDINNFISTLGFTSADYYSKLLENVVLSLVTELSRSHRCNSQQSISSRVTSMSFLCIPLITLPDVTPLLESLLSYYDDGSKEVLHSLFLERVNEAILEEKISLPKSVVMQLWLRHLPSLEKAVLKYIKKLITSQPSSVQEMVCLIKGSLLYQATCHPAIFRTTDEILKNVLLETDGAPEVMIVMQVFTQCFVQAYYESNEQCKFPLKAYFPHHPHSLVMALLKQPSDLTGHGLHQHLKCIAEILKTVEARGIRSCDDLFDTWFLFVHFGEWADTAAEQLLVSPAESSDAFLWLLAFYYNPSNENQQRTETMVEARSVYDQLIVLSKASAISITDLQTIFNSKINVRQPGTKQLLMHLIISFLLFTHNGNTISREFANLAVRDNNIAEITGLLIRLSNRISQLGVRYQRILELANDLLQKLKCGL